MIGQVETPGNILPSVVPLQIAGQEPQPEENPDQRAIATVTIIAPSNEMAGQINDLLHTYSDMLVGRMGMPYRECGLYLITVTLDGSRERIAQLTHRLNILPDISVKTTFAKGCVFGKEAP